jgi:hypothetical protein
MTAIDRGLHTRMAALQRRVAASVAARRRHDPEPDDPFRGLYISDDAVDALLATDSGRLLPPERGDEPSSASVSPSATGSADATTPGDRLGELATRFELTPFDVALLVVSMAPDLDSRYERLYGYLHDDVTRRRASIGLALELAGADPTDAWSRGRLTASAPLVVGGIVEVEDLSRPFLTRTLRVPDRVTAHLLGDDTPPAELDGLAVDATGQWEGDLEHLVRVLASGGLVHLRERAQAGASDLAVAALVAAGFPPVVVDLIRADPLDRDACARTAAREARLLGGGLVVASIDGLEAAVVRSVASSPVPVVLIGSVPWDPMCALRVPYALHIDPPSAATQHAMWLRNLGPAERTVATPGATFRLGPGQIRRAVGAARTLALASARPLATDDLRAGVRSQNATGLGRLARRVTPSAGWDDIVLDGPTERTLRLLVARVEQRARVLDAWGLRRGGSRGEGVSALFAGGSGTGKTLAAEVVARSLGVDLYVIDLSTVVDKYVGETEKNLERIFAEAEGVNGLLFFDEADALFGKRSEVSDARDRYANVEVAYLLQRMETFDGVAVLATNMRANLDEAFARRLAVIVDFPDPEPETRRRLWEVLLGAVPCIDDVDLDFCAHAFELTGGDIRNVVVTAAHLAAAEDRVVTMTDLIRATHIEYRKLGRLCNEREFGPFYGVVRAG